MHEALQKVVGDNLRSIGTAHFTVLPHSVPACLTKVRYEGRSFVAFVMLFKYTFIENVHPASSSVPFSW